jgi:hypothetical protein
MNVIEISPPLPVLSELTGPFFKRLGYGDGRTVPAHVRSHGEKALSEVLSSAEPVGRMGYGHVRSVSGKFIVAGSLRLESVLWAALARNASNPLDIAVFALTLGPVKGAFESGSVSYAYFLHEAGSVVMEKTADLFTRELAKEKRRNGLCSSLRFSPGYCDIPMSVQEEVFQILRPENIGMVLHESGEMTPIKSMTGCVLFSPEFPAFSPCGFCRTPLCLHRRL